MTNHQIHIACVALSATAAMLTLVFWDITPMRILGGALSLCAGAGMLITLWRDDRR